MVGKISMTDMKNFMFLYFSEGSSSISVEKFTGAVDYRGSKRSMEICLAGKI